jgi:ABC-type transporter Mla MlaB component
VVTVSLAQLDVGYQRKFNGSVVFAVAGTVDWATAAQLADAVFTAVSAAPAVLVVDLTGVTFLSSAGLAVLVDADYLGEQFVDQWFAAGELQPQHTGVGEQLQQLFPVRPGRSPRIAPVRGSSARTQVAAQIQLVGSATAGVAGRGPHQYHVGKPPAGEVQIGPAVARRVDQPTRTLVHTRGGRQFLP